MFENHCDAAGYSEGNSFPSLWAEVSRDANQVLGLDDDKDSPAQVGVDAGDRLASSEDFKSLLSRAVGGGTVTDADAERIAKLVESGDQEQLDSALRQIKGANETALLLTADILGEGSSLQNPFLLAQTVDSSQDSSGDKKVDSSASLPTGEPGAGPADLTGNPPPPAGSIDDSPAEAPSAIDPFSALTFDEVILGGAPKKEGRAGSRLGVSTTKDTATARKSRGGDENTSAVPGSGKGGEDGFEQLKDALSKAIGGGTVTDTDARLIAGSLAEGNGQSAAELLQETRKLNEKSLEEVAKRLFDITSGEGDGRSLLGTLDLLNKSDGLPRGTRADGGASKETGRSSTKGKRLFDFASPAIDLSKDIPRTAVETPSTTSPLIEPEKATELDPLRSSLQVGPAANLPALELVDGKHTTAPVTDLPPLASFDFNNIVSLSKIGMAGQAKPLTVPSEQTTPVARGNGNVFSPGSIAGSKRGSSSFLLQ